MKEPEMGGAWEGEAALCKFRNQGARLWAQPEGATSHLENEAVRLDIILMTKVRLDKTMVHLAVVYRYESWTIKKAER